MKVNTPPTPLPVGRSTPAEPAAAPRPAAPTATGAPHAADRFDGRVAPRPGAATDALRQQVSAALTAGDDAICALSDAAIAAATPDEKVAMLRTLISPSDGAFGRMVGRLAGGGGETRDISPLPVRESRQRAIVRILGSAPDAASFDRLFFRVNTGSLLGAVNGTEDRQVRELVARHRASARPGDWNGYVQYLDTVAQTSSAGKNKIDFLVDGAEVTPVAREAILAAKKSIHVSVFQLQPDEIGWAFARRLADKAKEGVKVRVLLDEFGTNTDGADKAKELIDFLRTNGVETVVNKAPIHKSHLDHRKVMVIDGKVGFTGGMNIGHHYQVEWHDQQTRIEGPAVSRLQDAFLARWKAEGGTLPVGEDLYPPPSKVSDGIEMRVVTHDGNGKDQNIKAAYLRAIDTAATSIRVANPYFADADVVEALSRAARRGVKVQVVLPRENDMGVVQRAARAYYPEMIAAGVEVYEYKGRMAHQKVAVIDGTWATAGSSNLDARSLEFNDELNYVSVDPRLAKDIDRKLFDVDLAQSERITQHRATIREWLDRKIAKWI